MNETHITLQMGGEEITLIGTAHVSRESIDEVNRVIREKQPGLVCVELDAGRLAAMTEQDNWERLDVAKVFREGKGFLLMVNLVLAGFQRRLGQELGVKPGEEMKTAINTAEELGIPHALCDREVRTTLRRAWARCGLWSKCKLLAALLSSAFTKEKLNAEEIENLKKQNELERMMGELAEYLPPVKETLIDERDRYLAAKIWASGLAAAGQSGNNRVVAVVGAGHLGGIKTHLEKIAAGEEGQDTAALDLVPPRNFLSKAAGWIIPGLILALIVLGFFRSGAEVSTAMLLRWALFNGSLAALGALLALGHPLAVAAAFFGAPVATINPLIGVGLFSG
ncbi:MAG: TraB/GumN family protein, partial [Treponema sp.]|nr:TraB/GumN family protein [Treponema sp.]